MSIETLKSAGFSQEEISEHLLGSGFSSEEISQYFEPKEEVPHPVLGKTFMVPKDVEGPYAINLDLMNRLTDGTYEKMLPLAVKNDFYRITGMFSKPDEQKAKVESSWYYALEHNIPTDIAMGMNSSLNNILYGKIPYTTAWERTKNRFQGGKTQVKMMDLGYDILNQSWKNPEAYEQRVKEVQQLQSRITDDVRKDFRGFWEKSFGATAEQLPIMWEGLKAGGPAAIGGGIIGGTLFGILGNVVSGGMTLATPEEAVTIPAGVKLGAKIFGSAAAANRIRQLEAGGMFLELMQITDDRGNKIDPKTAVVASHAVGAINGGIEIAEWMLLLKTFGIGGKLFEKSIGDVTKKLVAEGTIKQVVLNGMARYGIALAGETLQEVEQESTNIVFTELAKKLNNARKGTDFKPITVEDLKKRYYEVTAESARAFGILVAPGTTVTTMLDLIQQKAEAKKAAKAPDKVVKVPGQEAEAPKAITPPEGEIVQPATAQGQEIAPEKQPWEMTKEKLQNEYKRLYKIEKPTETNIQQERDVKDSFLKIALTEFDKSLANIKEPWQITTKELKVPGAMKTIPKDSEISGGARIAIPSAREKGAWQVSQISADIVLGKAIPFTHVEFETKEGALEYLKNVHKNEVKEAVEQNKPVPRNVLEEYSGEKWADEALAKLETKPISKTEQVIEKKRIISEEAYKKAKKELTDFGTLQAGINPKQFANLATVGAYHIENGLRTFADWSKQMIDDFGENVVPHLQKIWKKSQKSVVPSKPLIAQKLEGEESQRAKNLIKKIHTIKTHKGLTDTHYKEIKKKIAGQAKRSDRMTLDELEQLVKAMEKARPRKIGSKTVVTKKTEKAIQSLKEHLEKKFKMTDEAFQEILDKEVQGKEPKYIDGEHFITQTEGREILSRMHDEAEILEVSQPAAEAVSKNKEVSEQIDILKERISQKKTKDPWRTESMRYYVQKAQRIIGKPIYAMYRKLIELNDIMKRTHVARMQQLANAVPGFHEIASDEKALLRVAQYIASKSRLKVEVPTDITKNEIKLAEEIEKIAVEYELKARVNKFFRWLRTSEGIAEYDQFKKEIHKAEDIYNSQGKEALIGYLKTQTWGVIKSGYEPLETFIWKIKLYDTGPKTVGTGHIKVRTAIEYHKQERNILQRMSSYMKQMDMLYDMSPKINAFVRMFDDNMEKFSSPELVQQSIETFLRNLKNYNVSGGFWGDLFARVYAQVSQIIIMANPVLAFRNLFQNLAFAHDKTNLIDPRNKSLTDSDIEYLETHVNQMRSMMEEYFLTGEKAIFGTRHAMKLLRKISIYPWSDVTNRHWGFWGKINQVRRALESKKIKDIMVLSKFEDMTEEEQITALEILALEGNDAMAQYVAGINVADTHFRYARVERSPSEMDILGRVMGNLLLFPRAYGEKMGKATAKLISSNATYEERKRAAKRIVAVMAGGYLAGSVYTMITGRERNPYDPFGILQISPGGLVLGATTDLFKVGGLTLQALTGDKEALYKLTSAVPDLADDFIPFYNWTLRGLEAATDSKNLDRMALREIYAVIDNEYEVRGGAYKLERNFIQKLQYVFAGPSIDKKIEERKKEAGF